jgi:hypothetical protein
MKNHFRCIGREKVSMRNHFRSNPNDFGSKKNDFASNQNHFALMQNRFASNRNRFALMRNDFASNLSAFDWLCTKIAERLGNAQNPHFSSGVQMGVSAPELKCAPSAKIEFLCKAPLIYKLCLESVTATTYIVSKRASL